MAKMIELTGNTYPVKDQIKALGGKWDKDKKCWLVPDYAIGEAKALVNNAPKSKVKSAYRPTKCKICGALARKDPRGYPIVKIYRNGICQDCYEEHKMGY